MYLRNREEWTHSRIAACDFQHVGAAILFVTEEKLTHMEVVMAFDDPRFDMTVPTRA